MSDDVLFFKYDLTLMIQNQQKELVAELDRMSDEQLLNTTMGQLEDYCVEKYRIDLPVLGEPQVEQRRTKMMVGRYGQEFGWGNEGGVQVDAEQFTLEVPYTGDEALFWTRGNQWNSMPPRGSVNSRFVSTSILLREPDADRINQEFDRFIKDLNEWLGYLRGDVETWNGRIGQVVHQHVDQRRQRAEKAQTAASGLKFAMKARADGAATFSAPVARKKIAPVLPKPAPNAAPEPVLSNEAYRDILDTLQQMSEVMERSPHAFAAMDEETLRFQFLIPLNARFEGEARGEVFNYGGKTDILITYKGRNIFIAECKIWKGAAALTEAIDQLLGYLSWRDTKAVLMVFNRNKAFSNVLAQIEPTVTAHPSFVSADGKTGETEFQYTFHHRDDPATKRELHETHQAVKDLGTALEQAAAVEQQERAYLAKLPKAVVTSATNVRAKPERSAHRLTKLKVGDIVAVTDRRKSWTKCVYRDQLTGSLAEGWIYMSNLEQMDATDTH